MIAARVVMMFVCSAVGSVAAMSESIRPGTASPCASAAVPGWTLMRLPSDVMENTLFTDPADPAASITMRCLVVTAEAKAAMADAPADVLPVVDVRRFREEAFAHVPQTASQYPVLRGTFTWPGHSGVETFYGRATLPSQVHETWLAQDGDAIVFVTVNTTTPAKADATSRVVARSLFANAVVTLHDSGTGPNK